MGPRLVDYVNAIVGSKPQKVAEQQKVLRETTA